MIGYDRSSTRNCKVLWWDTSGLHLTTISRKTFNFVVDYPLDHGRILTIAGEYCQVSWLDTVREHDWYFKISGVTFSRKGHIQTSEAKSMMDGGERERETIIKRGP